LTRAALPACPNREGAPPLDNPLSMFGSMVFGDAEMRERLPADVYAALTGTIREGKKLDASIVDIVAEALRDWAMSKGVTHFSHWFQPLTGVTAEKHDSFIGADANGGMVAKFTGKDLVRGEPDASSLPSGGLRATFEARGYTAWDPTSYAFIKEGILCIPSTFYSYGGAALDKKTPLLRSMECISVQAVRLLHLIGETGVKRVYPMLGLEQEYFLIDRDLYKQRRDLVFCGRTLFGAKPPKGQELDDHYYGEIKPRVLGFMKELNEELWKLGILAKTEHNETAPAQHELAPIHTTMNTAADHNQLTMEMMRKVAEKHNFACLLHEKPFEGVNGSAKHNNWSLSTDAGRNLFDYGKDPMRNTAFLLFLTAVIAAADERQDLLRLSAAGLGNDMRLGANEAPPAIMSIYLGDELTSVFEAIENGAQAAPVRKTAFKNGVKTQPEFTRDTSDRNRTSPFAFTGNKLEFRMLGSSFSASELNIVLNTIVAEQLNAFSDRLERDGCSEEAVMRLIRETYKKHRRILFNGNNYAGEWRAEAKRRRLLNLETAVDALPHYISKKNISLFINYGIFSHEEILSRYEVLLEGYIKAMRIEALTMLDMARSQILPAASAFSGKLADSALRLKTLSADAECAYETDTAERISELASSLHKKALDLDNALRDESGKTGDLLTNARYYKDTVMPRMRELRIEADAIEPLIARSDWPYPGYADLLSGV